MKRIAMPVLFVLLAAAIVYGEESRKSDVAAQCDVREVSDTL